LCSGIKRYVLENGSPWSTAPTEFDCPPGLATRRIGRAGTGDNGFHADIRNGEVFLNQVYAAVTASPVWSSTMLVFNFDAWGGFFDHVPPPAAPIPPTTGAAGDTDGRRGFRVPALIIAPWARRGAVAHKLFDHTSVLSMVEWRWGLPWLTIRDKTAHNLASALDFEHPLVTAPQFNMPPGPFGGACPVGLLGATSTSSATATSTTANANEEWNAIQTLARQYGWPV
jgi:phospholipase C